MAIGKWGRDDLEDEVTDRVVFATNYQGDNPADLQVSKASASGLDPEAVHFLFAILLFNTWMLVDRLAKKRLGMEFTGEPHIQFEMFVAAVANFVRPVD